ncbi:MAG: S-ribosylhomocysteine lyase [Trueperaceae bacterium]|nr:S-ribosylhomocysteine lyase [Trueperaceae bacterium]
MSQPKTKVESFDLDHTKVRAPYVRLAGKYQGPGGDEIRKYDLRLVQPNQAEIPTAALHTIEHLFAGYLRDNLNHKIIDASPMGCRTGFYLTILGVPADDEVKTALKAALEGVLSHEGKIPGCSVLECGNYRDHSIEGAKAWAESILAHDIIVQETIPISR